MIHHLLCATIALLPLAATAEQCGPLDQVTAGLLKQYGESPVMMGRTDQGAEVVVFGNPVSHTWTALVVSPSGTARMKTAGTGLELPAPVAPGDPA